MFNMAINLIPWNVKSTEIKRTTISSTRKYENPLETINTLGTKNECSTGWPQAQPLNGRQ